MFQEIENDERLPYVCASLLMLSVSFLEFLISDSGEICCSADLLHLFVSVAGSLSPSLLSPWSPRSLLTRHPAFALTLVSEEEEEEEEEEEQQNKGHQDPDQHVPVPLETLGWSDVMNEPKVPFNGHPLCARHLLGSVVHLL